MADAFGVVALVALTPLIAVRIMGLVYKWKDARATGNAALSVEELNEIEEWEDSEDDTE